MGRSFGATAVMESYMRRKIKLAVFLFRHFQLSVDSDADTYADCFAYLLKRDHVQIILGIWITLCLRWYGVGKNSLLFNLYPPCTIYAVI